MSYILLAGAGFSRNWGGWLANEAFPAPRKYVVYSQTSRGAFHLAEARPRNTGDGKTRPLTARRLSARSPQMSRLLCPR